MVYYKYLCIARTSSSNGSTARLMETMKRCAQTVLHHGGVFRKVENLGTRELAYSISRKDTTGKSAYEKFYEGTYFFIHFDSKPKIASQIDQELKQCPEVIRYLPHKDKISPHSNLQKKFAGGHLKKPFKKPVTDSDYESWTFV